MNDIFRYHPYKTKFLDTDEVFTRAKVQPDRPSNFAQKVRKKYLTFVAISQFRPFRLPKYLKIKVNLIRPIFLDL